MHLKLNDTVKIINYSKSAEAKCNLRQWHNVHIELFKIICTWQVNLRSGAAREMGRGNI